MQDRKAQTYFPLDGILNKTVFWIYANVAIAFVSLPIEIWIDRAPDEHGMVRESYELMQSLGALGVLGAELVTALVAGILFLKWMYRAYMNSRVLLGDEDDKASRKTARMAVVGGFLIPIYSLFKPYRNMCMLWRASDVKAGRNEKTWEAELYPVPKAIGAWWGTFLLFSFLDRATNKLNGDALVVMLVLAAVVRLVSGVLVVRLARAITERQTHKIHMLQAQNQSA